MKKLSVLVAFVAVFGLAASSFAQAAGPKGGKAPAQGGRPGGGGMGGGRMMMGQRGQGMRDKVFAKLNLTADQKAKIKKADAEMMAKFQKMFGAQTGGPGAGPKAAGAPKNGAKPGQAAPSGGPRRAPMTEAQRAEMQKAGKDYQTKLKTIMGAAKFAQYEKLMKAEMEAMRKEFEKNRPAGGGRPGGAGPRGGR